MYAMICKFLCIKNRGVKIMARPNKVRENYRLYEQTIKQIDFLAEKLEYSKTDIVELAVNYLADTYRKAKKTNVPASRNMFASAIVKAFSEE
jgi:hypothetical protein